MSEPAIKTKAIAALLAPALGQEKGEELVRTAARTLGLDRERFSPDEVRALFACIARASGLVGLVARFALDRGEIEDLIAEKAARPASVAPPRPPVDILALLTPAIGYEKARDVVHGAAKELGVSADGCDRETALALLEIIGRTEGIVGVVARFARTRVLLEPG